MEVVYWYCVYDRGTVIGWWVRWFNLFYRVLQEDAGCHVWKRRVLVKSKADGEIQIVVVVIRHREAGSGEYAYGRSLA
jgi:hypothetical protein